MKRRLRHIANRIRSYLTAQQRAELRLAVAECNDPNNLVSHEEAVIQIEKWLKRPKKLKQEEGISVNLTSQQAAELDAAIAETYDPTKLIDHEDVMKKYSKWLKQ